MGMRRIRDYLDGSAIRYSVVNVPSDCAPSSAAQMAGVPNRQLARVVIVRVDDNLAMAVLPANKELNLISLRRETAARDVCLADEKEYASRFSDCQSGAVPPFGNIFGMETFLDRSLINEDRIAFSSGTPQDVIVMRVMDYVRAVRPLPVRVAAAPTVHRQDSANRLMFATGHDDN